MDINFDLGHGVDLEFLSSIIWFATFQEKNNPVVTKQKQNKTKNKKTKTKQQY